MTSPRHYRPQLAAHGGQRRRTEVARIPAPTIMETEQPDLAVVDPPRAPRHMCERPAHAVARGRSAVREGHAVDRNTLWFDFHHVARQGPEHLRDRFRPART